MSVEMKIQMAKQFALNLKQRLDLFKTAQGQVKDRCPCCNQVLPNPYTQEWLGQQCGMTKATIVHYFQGNRMPTVIAIAKIAKALNCSIIDLLDGFDDINN